MIVISLTKVPPSLRGDLTKWYQEIQTGVYVGNVSARVRDELWERILRDIGNGQAVMAYNAQNELGYQFRTTRKNQQVIDYDGIPLLMRLNESSASAKHGFSRASKMHRAKMSAKKAAKAAIVEDRNEIDFVALDIETTGTHVLTDQIIAIGAVKQSKVGIEEFSSFISIEHEVPATITKLTGISTDLLTKQGKKLEVVLAALRSFLGDLPILGYNVHFDQQFLDAAFRSLGQDALANAFVDILPVVKRTNEFLDNYRLETVLEEYDITNEHPHHAVDDAKATLALATKLMKNGGLTL
jgi:CRISPR-associated protein Cas2